MGRGHTGSVVPMVRHTVVSWLRMVTSTWAHGNRAGSHSGSQGRGHRNRAGGWVHRVGAVPCTRYTLGDCRDGLLPVSPHLGSGCPWPRATTPPTALALPPSAHQLHCSPGVGARGAQQSVGGCGLCRTAPSLLLVPTASATSCSTSRCYEQAHVTALP